MFSVLFLSIHFHIYAWMNFPSIKVSQWLLFDKQSAGDSPYHLSDWNWQRLSASSAPIHAVILSRYTTFSYITPAFSAFFSLEFLITTCGGHQVYQESDCYQNRAMIHRMEPRFWLEDAGWTDIDSDGDRIILNVHGKITEFETCNPWQLTYHILRCRQRDFHQELLCSPRIKSFNFDVKWRDCIMDVRLYLHTSSLIPSSRRSTVEWDVYASFRW